MSGKAILLLIVMFFLCLNCTYFAYRIVTEEGPLGCAQPEELDDFEYAYDTSYCWTWGSTSMTYECDGSHSSRILFYEDTECSIPHPTQPEKTPDFANGCYMDDIKSTLQQSRCFETVPEGLVIANHQDSGNCEGNAESYIIFKETTCFNEISGSYNMICNDPSTKDSSPVIQNFEDKICGGSVVSTDDQIYGHDKCFTETSTSWNLYCNYYDRRRQTDNPCDESTRIECPSECEYCDGLDPFILFRSNGYPVRCDFSYDQCYKDDECHDVVKECPDHTVGWVVLISSASVCYLICCAVPCCICLCVCCQKKCFLFGKKKERVVVRPPSIKGGSADGINGIVNNQNSGKNGGLGAFLTENSENKVVMIGMGVCVLLCFLLILGPIGWICSIYILMMLYKVVTQQLEDSRYEKEKTHELNEKVVDAQISLEKRKSKYYRKEST